MDLLFPFTGNVSCSEYMLGLKAVDSGFGLSYYDRNVKGQLRNKCLLSMNTRFGL